MVALRMGMVLRIGLVVLIVSAVAGVYWAGHHAGSSSVQNDWDAYRLEQTRQIAKTSKANQYKERELINAAQNAQDRLAAATRQSRDDLDSALSDIRSDNLKLRERFRSCSSRVPEDAATIGGNDGAGGGGLSETDEGNFVRIADECNRVVHVLTAWQERERSVTDYPSR